MKIEQIKQALEIHKTGSINKAASNLFIAQSTLSTSISALERELGQKIFIRDKHGTVETKYGKEFIKLAKEMLDTYQKMQSLAKETKMLQQKNRFCVAIRYLEFAVRLFIDGIYNQYRSENTEFQFHECTGTKMIHYVSKGNSEIGVFALPNIFKALWLELFAANGLEYFKLTTESPKILMRKDHPVALNTTDDTVSFRTLEDYSLFYYEEENEVFNLINHAILDKYKIKQYIGFSGKGVKEMLYKTDGYLLGIFNENAYSEHIYDENIRVFKLEGDDLFYYELGYVKRIGVPLSELGAKYIELLTSALKSN